MKFSSRKIKEIFYETLSEGWIDKNTYLVTFNDMKDCVGDVFHIEAKYHADENKVTFTKVYADETMDAESFISPCFKTQIEEYILNKVGVLHGCMTRHNIMVELTLDIPIGYTIHELKEWLDTLNVNVTSNKTEVNILKTALKG